MLITLRRCDFHDSCGGIPGRVLDRSVESLRNQDTAPSAFEGAPQLRIMVPVGMREEAGCGRFADPLLGLQMSDGSWPASSVLRVPDARKGEGEHTPAYGDCKRLISTAMMAQSSRLWPHAEKRAAAAGGGI